MIQLLLLLVSAQIPAVPGETTLVSFCKQGSLSACEALRQVNPKLAADIEAEVAKVALAREALKVAEEAREKGDAKAEESSEAEASDEPPNCKGQEHHIISRPIAEELEKHRVLRGLYKPRDARFKTRAKDLESHCGYQEWHRKVDEEVIKWLRDFPNATPEQFMRMLREIYSRKEMLERFPYGF
ncbi:MAG: Wall-associated protein precursor [Hyalangium sp.]|uniref:Wall-associated protein precursor n=1 Tax=Hyalangium sp. TaxID=2028555 RepID=UPI00389A5315